eukprot:SAG31_NODE_3465_length_4243_cov_8.202220_2_plen_139_part_00
MALHTTQCMTTFLRKELCCTVCSHISDEAKQTPSLSLIVAVVCCHAIQRMGANGLKSDFGGHDNKHFQNIYAFVSVCFGAPMPFRYFHGFNDAFTNNTCAFEIAPRTLSCTSQSRRADPHAHACVCVCCTHWAQLRIL